MGCFLHCLFRFFPVGEFLLLSPAAFNPRLHMAWEDMAVDNPQATSMIKFPLKQSKTDQLGRGVNVIIGRTGLQGCRMLPYRESLL